MLEALGNLGDFVGGLAVIVTLIYLASQIRQNTQALHGAARQDAAASTRLWLEVLMRDGVGEAYSTGLREYPEMSATQKRLFAIAFDYQANTAMEAFALYEAGALDQETFDAYVHGLASHIITPGGALRWKHASPFYTPGFVEMVDARVADGDFPDLLETAYFQLDEPSHP